MLSSLTKRKTIIASLFALTIGAVAFGVFSSTSANANSSKNHNHTGAFIADDGSVSVKGISLSRDSKQNLIFGGHQDPSSLDPAYIGDYGGAILQSSLYEGLLKFKSGTTEIVPSLAERYTISPDGKEYTFYLRKGVKFSDGTPFNAEAVKYNYDRQTPANRKPGMAYAPVVYANVKDVVVVDDNTVKFILSQPSTPFLNNMAMLFAASIASPTAIAKGEEYLNEHPTGTGQYVLYRWDHGQQIILTANPLYWGEKPKIENIIYKTIPDPSSRIVALNNGEVDLASGIEPASISRVLEKGNKIFKITGSNTNYLAFNQRPGRPTTDIEVRRAIAQAINVPEVVSVLSEGVAEPAHSLLAKFINGYSDKTHTTAYDPEAARKTFKEKGIKHLTIVTNSGSAASNVISNISMAESIQAYLKKVGVDSTINVYDQNTYVTKTQDNDYDLCFLSWTTDNFDADNFFSYLATDDPISNRTLWKNDKFLELIKLGLQTPRGPERDAIYQKADQLLQDDVGIFPLSYGVNIVAYRPNIGGDINQPTGIPHLNNITKN